MPYGLIHKIAECRECSWHNENYLRASKAAHRHHENTGHVVAIEAGYAWTIGESSAAKNKINS